MEKNYHVVVFGGTSAIALAYVRTLYAAMTKQGNSLSVTLVGRNETKLQAEAKDLGVLGANVKTVKQDLSQYDASKFAKLGDFDEFVLAYGTLTNQNDAAQDQAYREKQIQTNFTSAAHWLEDAVDYFSKKGSGNIIVIGSVAGDRGRQSNYVYGAAKSALETYAQGLQHRLGKSKNINLLLVKPGFVDTPMTADIENKGPLWAKPEKVGRDILKSKGKRSRTIYTPWFWYWIMFVIRSVPSRVFEKTKL